ncbi:hypothetical protein [Bartonella gabonensis]|nr:hypothetical protein [Bartonella gabonensis]
MKFKKELNTLKEKINKVVEREKEVQANWVEAPLAIFYQILFC